MTTYGLTPNQREQATPRILRQWAKSSVPNGMGNDNSCWG